MLGCKIRGLRNPANRPTHISKAARSEPNDQHQDDGTRVVSIIGCEYRLTESEILNWLVKFGEVKSEITEEILQEEDRFQDPTLPPVGNGTYLVTMKLKKDMPNWVPMYGRRVRLEYKGIRKQCNNCYGKHIKKYCKSDKVKMEEFAEIFKTQFPEIPEDHYGWLAKIRPEAVVKPRSELLLNQASGGLAQDGVQAMVNPNPLDSGSSKIKLSLRKTGNSPWRSTQTENPSNAVQLPNNTRPVIEAKESVTQNETFVESIFNGIRATFRPQPGIQPMGVNHQASKERLSHQSSGSTRGRGRGKLNQ